MSTKRLAQHLMPGDVINHQGRELTVVERGPYKGTVKVFVEGFKFPLDLAPRKEFTLISDSQAESPEAA